MNIDDLLTVGPHVTPIDDPRVRFYMENRQIIDTWASLRDEAAAALHDRLLDLVDTLSADVEQVGERDISIQAAEVEKGTPRVQMIRPSWIDDSGTSPVAAVVEWSRTVIDRTGNLWVYVGLRAKMSHPPLA